MCWFIWFIHNFIYFSYNQQYIEETIDDQILYISFLLFFLQGYFYKIKSSKQKENILALLLNFILIWILSYVDR